MMLPRIVLLLTSVFVLGLAPSISSAQEYPNRSIRYIIPFQGIPDQMTRAYHERVSSILKQPVVHDFKPGVAGRLALIEVARATPDGYTIGMASTSPLLIHPLLYQRLPYTTDKSFEMLSVLGTSSLVLAVSAKSGIKTLDDLRALSEKRSLNIATGGVGGPHHLAAMLLQKAGFRAELVHYKTSAEVLPSMVSGAVDAFFSTVAQQAIFVRQGFYHAIGVTSQRRVPQLPNVPTFSELGHPEIDVDTYYASVAPAGTPPAILDRLAAAYAEAAKSPEIVRMLNEMALTPVYLTRHELKAEVLRHQERWRQFIKENNITVE